MLSDMGTMINRRRVCGGEKGLLPSGYKQLEYIENTSNAYIDTGTYFNDDTTFECKLMRRLYGWFLGWRYVSNPITYGQMRSMFVYDDGRIGIRFGEGATNTTFKLQKNVSYILSFDGNSVFVDGVNVYNNVPKVVLSYNGKFYFFWTDAEAEGFYSDDITHGLFRFYYIKVKQNNVLVRHLIPCINPNNVVGMYDTVNGVFYSSPNGTAFVAGPEV